MSYILNSDVSTVAFTTNYSPDLGVVKTESIHRSANGRRFNYKWEDHLVHKHSMSYVSSADANILNTWWLNGTFLTYSPEYAPSDVSTVVLGGAKRPASKFEKPYNDLFIVKIIVEETT